MYLENEKEIPIIIKTTQTDSEGQSETSEISITAISGTSDGVEVLIYELEDSVNILLIYNNFVKMIKSGEIEAEMTFDINKVTSAKFTVPGGTIVFDIRTNSIVVRENAILELEYDLSSEGQSVSSYKLSISDGI